MLSTQTVSPAMDIQFAYNLERMLYFISGRDEGLLKEIMTSVEAQYRSLDAAVSREHRVRLPEALLTEVQRLFLSYSVSDEETLRTIARFHNETGFVLCPHSATAVHVATQVYLPSLPEAGDHPVVAVLTAHPDKFEATVRRALRDFGGKEEALPSPFPSAAVQRLRTLPQRYAVLRKRDGQSESEASWRERWIERLRADIVAANADI